MDDATRALVRRRAGRACEYCRMPEIAVRAAFQVDHIVACQHGGSDADANLAWCCQHCNSHKGPNLSGLDPDTGQLSRLFHPRRDVWADHFEWSAHLLLGKTPVGRATIAALAINDHQYRVLRAALMFEGVFPP